MLQRNLLLQAEKDLNFQMPETFSDWNELWEDELSERNCEQLFWRWQVPNRLWYWLEAEKQIAVFATPKPVVSWQAGKSHQTGQCLQEIRKNTPADSSDVPGQAVSRCGMMAVALEAFCLMQSAEM